MKYVTVFFVLLSLIPVQQGEAQTLPEKMDTELQLLTTVAGDRHQPFWLTHNRWGIFDEESANGLFLFSSRKLPDTEERLFDWGGGFALTGRVSRHSTLHIHEGYLEAGLGILRLEAGRKKQIRGETFGLLSSGSTGRSLNAAPVPRITLSIPEFEPVPLTGGWLEFKGHLSHGWFSNRRQARDLPEQRGIGLRNTYLHEKSFYLQTGGDTGVKLYTGLIHFAEWGGVTDDGRRLPQTFGDLLKVAGALEGNDEATGIDRANALGAHYGLWDWGLKAGLWEDAGLHLYYQHFFTDASGLWYRNLKDGLYGLGIRDPFNSEWLTGIVWEFLYSKHQTGHGLPDPQAGDSPAFCEQVNCGYRFNGRDDYYNNDYYLSGWSYHSRPIGNPLFLTRSRLNQVSPDIEVYSPRYFAGNRVIAHHLGLEGKIHENMSWRLLATWNRHYGTYWGLNLGQPWGSLDPSNDPQEYFFNPPRHQWYAMLETEFRIPRIEQLSLRAALAVDRGDLFDNTGVLVGVGWRFSGGERSEKAERRTLK